MAVLPRFNFTRLLFDMAVEHNIPPPVFISAPNPFLGRFAAVCQYDGVDAIGGGGSHAEACNAAARQVWLELGHLITWDPR